MLIPQLAEIALAERPELLSLTSAQMADTNARYNVLIQQANLNYETASSVNPPSEAWSQRRRGNN